MNGNKVTTMRFVKYVYDVVFMCVFFLHWYIAK